MSVLAVAALAAGVGVELGRVSIVAAGFSPVYDVGAVIARWHHDPGVEWTVGGRLPLHRAEAFGGVALAPSFGPWCPAVGFELGLSSVTGTPPDDPALAAALAAGQALPGTRADSLAAYGPLYAAITTAPLRFRIDSVTLSALALSVGTTLAEPGHVLRLHALLGQAVWTP